MNITIKIVLGVVVVGVFGLIAYFFFPRIHSQISLQPTQVTLSGTYICAPAVQTITEHNEECPFGFKTDDGVVYAVNFGQSPQSMELFKRKAHITAEGFVVEKESLSTNQWAAYDIEGLFTITRMIDPAPASQGKLDISVVCASALAYTTFPDGASAEAFVNECKEGKHPEVIERYKKDMGLGDAVSI